MKTPLHISPQIETSVRTEENIKLTEKKEKKMPLHIVDVCIYAPAHLHTPYRVCKVY